MGGTLGTVITWPLLGAIIEQWNWSWALFIPGGVCIAWCVMWYALVSDTPEEHPRISEEEKKYIFKCLGESIQKTKVFLLLEIKPK